MEEPKSGVEIFRDAHCIPHIYGETRCRRRCTAQAGSPTRTAACCSKRGLGPAFVAALSPPGLNAFELLLTGRSFKPSAQAEA